MPLGPTLENGGGGTDGGTLDLEGREDDDRGSIGGERVPTFGSPAEAARAGEFGATDAAQAGRVGGERPRTFDSPAEAAEAGEFDTPEFIAVTGGTVVRNVNDIDPASTPGVREATPGESTSDVGLDEGISDIDLGGGGGSGGGGGGAGGGSGGGGGPGLPDLQFPEFPEFDIPAGPDLNLAGPAAIVGVFVVVAIGVYALASNIPGAVAGR